jgi:hypothetical protein
MFFVIQWKPLNVINDIVIIRFMQSILEIPNLLFIYSVEPNIVTFWLMLSDRRWPKAITLSGFHCNVIFDPL